MAGTPSGPALALPDDYSAAVADHFASPRNAGEFASGPDIVATRAGNRQAGAEVHLSMRFEAGRVAAVRFRAYGCPHFVAAVSLATEQLPGVARADLGSWRAGGIGRALGVPAEKRGRLLILEDAVRAAVQ